MSALETAIARHIDRSCSKPTFVGRAVVQAARLLKGLRRKEAFGYAGLTIFISRA
jgi:hypothetical protein